MPGMLFTTEINEASFTVEKYNRMMTLIVKGELDLNNCHHLTQIFCDHFDPSCEQVIIDLTEVNYFDCSSLTALVRCLKKASSTPVIIRVQENRPPDRLLTTLRPICNERPLPLLRQPHNQ